MVEYYECVCRLCLAFNPKIKSRAWLAIGRMLKNVGLSFTSCTHKTAAPDSRTRLLHSIACFLPSLPLSSLSPPFPLPPSPLPPCLPPDSPLSLRPSMCPTVVWMTKASHSSFAQYVPTVPSGLFTWMAIASRGRDPLS